MRAWLNQDLAALDGEVDIGIGHHAAAPQSVDHIDLRPGFSPSSPSVFPDH